MITIYPIDASPAAISDVEGLEAALDTLAAADVIYNEVTGEGNLATSDGDKRIILL